MIYLGIDIGSSFLKAAAFDVDAGKAVAHRTIPAPGRLPDPDPKKFEISAAELLRTVRGLAEDTLQKAGSLDGILLSTQMHGFVYRTGNAEDRYISWQDSRCTGLMPGEGLSYLEYLRRLFPPERMETCGVYIKPSLGLCNLFALLHSDSSPAPDGELFTLGSYLIAGLTGNNVCHITNAAPLGLADVVAGEWDAGVLERAGLSRIRLPRIARKDTEICGYCEIGGRKIPVYPDFGDQQTAILGCMAGPEDVIVNIATASQLSRTADCFSPGAYEVRPYFEGKYINVISNMPGGRNLDVLIRFLKDAVRQITGGEVTEQQVWRAVQSSFEPESRGLTADLGFYDTPANMEGGAISHIRPENFELIPLFSAAFENMALCYGRNLETLVDKNSWEGGLVFSGGVSWKTPELLRVIGERTGRGYKLSSVPDETFAGLFRMALVCSGRCKTLADHPEITLKLD